LGFSGPVIPPYDLAGGNWTIEVDPDGPDGPDTEPDPSPTPTPEPGSLVMFGSGIMGLAGLLRRKINV
jgi:PEP-CTERM motif-containing protein